MKKIFAISFLSLMAVTGGARAEVEQYNLNLATAEYVDGIKEQLDNNKVSTSRVAESNSYFSDSSKDFFIPTVARMEAAIANAKPDTSGLVDKEHVVDSEGNNWNDESVAEDAETNKDDYVLTYGAAAKAINSVNTNLSAVINNKIAKDDIVTLAEDTAAVAEMEAGTNDAKYDTVVPSYRTVYNALNLLEAETDAGLDSKVDKAQGVTNKNAIMITNAAGNVIPALVGDCANTTNKCALVTGVDTNGNLVLQWEVIARNVVQPSAEE